MTTRFWRQPRVTEETGLPRSTLYREVSMGRFPKPVKLAGTSVAWLETEVREWMEERVRERDEERGAA